jgi:hypothetical protein
MATRTSKTSTVKAKADKVSAPKLGRARKTAAAAGDANTTTAHSDVTSDAIAVRAYERFCARGYVHGHDVEDWLAAERELQRGA